MAPEIEKTGDSAYVRKAPSSSDVEAEMVLATVSKDGLKRQMKDRHIAMISIGGVIGTGLFLGTATALETGGPLGMLLAYVAVGSLCYTVMISLGEMAAFLPIPGGHLTFAERFVDPALSFTLGWLYWYNWAIILPAELSAASVVISYWNKTVSSAVWIALCLVVVLTINIFGAGAYGEAEFIFASFKVMTIVGLLILGLVLDLGGGPNHDRIGFRYWKNPGAFVQLDGIGGAKGRFLAWSAVMSQAAFSFIGTEVVAIAGAEVKNPRRNIPKAIRNVYVRLLLFYIGGVFIIGLLVPSNDKRLNIADGTAAASPFVIAIDNAGIKVLPSIINAAILTSAWSAANSDLYCSSRALYGLALNGNAPSIFLKLTPHGLPWVSLATCSGFAFLAFMSTSNGGGKVFGWFANMTAVAGLSSWFGIAVTYIRFHRGLKAQGIDRKTLPYRSPLQPFAGWYAAIGCFMVALLNGWAVFLKGHWRADTFVTSYLPMMLFPVLYVGAKLRTRAPLVPYTEMDFQSGLQEVLDASKEDPPPRNWVERIWRKIM
ncbi:amino acid permease [Polyporus arcularius HHB13444]|uniref:Amino acid permease n=1 Tax=Polyporus arcularius HHB13444 TaxID=1314778 RepID=A0A5C3PQC7_9APHY|nr:amino acid permease [Polyporus arcularius HHB13444]